MGFVEDKKKVLEEAGILKIIKEVTEWSGISTEYQVNTTGGSTVGCMQLAGRK